MALDDHYDASKLAGHIVRVPRLPVAGFWVRAVAFLVDGIVLYFLLYLAALGGREALLSLGKWSPLLAMVVIYGYFWLLDGPVGKGRTVGKVLVNLRTVGREDSQPLSWGQAALRAAILLPPAFWVNSVLVPVFEPSRGSPVEFYVFSLLPGILSAGLYVAQMVHVAFNPMRQGFHDLASSSLVLTGDQLGTTWAALAEQGGEAALFRAKKAHQAGWIALAVLTLFFGYDCGQQVRKADQKGYFQERAVLQEKLLEHGVWEISGGAVPVGSETGEPGEGGTSEADGASTGTASSGAGSPEAALPPKQLRFNLLHRGGDPRSLPEIRSDVDELASWLTAFLGEQIQEAARQRAEEAQTRATDTEGSEKQEKPEAPALPDGSVFTFVYQEYLDLVMYQQAYEVYRTERVYRNGD